MVSGFACETTFWPVARAKPCSYRNRHNRGNAGVPVVTRRQLQLHHLLCREQNPVACPVSSQNTTWHIHVKQLNWTWSGQCKALPVARLHGGHTDNVTRLSWWWEMWNATSTADGTNVRHDKIRQRQAGNSKMKCNYYVHCVRAYVKCNEAVNEIIKWILWNESIVAITIFNRLICWWLYC